MLYAGVDTARTVYGSIQAYAFRTLVDPAGPRSGWRELNHARLNMAIVANAEVVGQDFVFSQLDGRGHTIKAYEGDLLGMLGTFYDADALFGDTPEDAYAVNTGPAVNTRRILADGMLKAVLSVRMCAARRAGADLHRQTADHRRARLRRENVTRGPI